MNTVQNAVFSPKQQEIEKAATMMARRGAVIRRNCLAWSVGLINLERSTVTQSHHSVQRVH